MNILTKTLIGAVVVLLASCSSQIKQVAPQELVQKQTPKVVPGLKHRVGIAVFEDKTGYGNNLFGQINDLGSQAADILSSHVIQSGQVVLLERQNLGAIKSEQDLQGATQGVASVSALIFGAVTEFGTKTEWVDAGLSKTKKQVAHAKVTLRMVDPKTGLAFYSEFGEANATNESTATLGFGGKASHDATLGDRALNGAIVKLVGNMLKTLNDKPWTAPIVDVEQGVIVGAGKLAGLKQGDVLSVYAEGRKVKNPSTGVMMSIPGAKAGEIQVDVLFGETAVDEGAICSTVLGGPFVKGMEVKKK